jgi:hypothetical protein
LDFFRESLTSRTRVYRLLNCVVSNIEAVTNSTDQLQHTNYCFA